MATYNLYSKRRRAELGQVIDVFQYDEISEKLRVQIMHIWKSVYAVETSSDRYITPHEELLRSVFAGFEEILCREYGLLTLRNRRNTDAWEAVADFLLNERDNNRVIDLIDLVFRHVNSLWRKHIQHDPRKFQSSDDAIEELNDRFRENGCGYQFESGQLIRVDSQFVHSEVVIPTLQFLSSPRFKGASEEFLSAHLHYRSQHFKESLNDCLKAFESTLKTILHNRGWTFSPKDNVSTLLKIAFEKKLIPDMMQSHFGGVRSTLEAGVPTLRNNLGGHGQGVTQVTVPKSIVSYALHLAATSILFLAQLDQELP